MKTNPEEMIHSIVARFDTDEELVVSTAYGDGGTNLLFPRLVRAAMNQCYDGDAMVSRYAIWANTARDHIAAAIHLIENNETEQATRLLVSAHNSLSAFSEIQKQLDPLNREMEA